MAKLKGKTRMENLFQDEALLNSTAPFTNSSCMLDRLLHQKGCTHHMVPVLSVHSISQLSHPETF